MSVATMSDDRHLNRDADIEMLQAVMAGDGTAYRGLVEKYQARVYTMIYGMVRNREDARDLTQEAFVKAYRNLSGFRLESGFYTWLFRIATNLAIDFMRKRGHREIGGYDEEIASRDEGGNLADNHGEDGPSRYLERRQLFLKIMDAMQHLSEEQRQVILLRELEGMQYREISDVMGIPEGTVMSRLFYARKKLQQLLVSTDDEDSE